MRDLVILTILTYGLMDGNFTLITHSSPMSVKFKCRTKPGPRQNCRKSRRLQTFKLTKSQ